MVEEEKARISEKKVKQEGKTVGNSYWPGSGTTHRVGCSKLNRKKYYKLNFLPFKAGIRLWFLPVWQQEDSRTWGWEEKNPDPKEGILFISTFDLDGRHIALFQKKCHWALPQCLPAGGQDQQTTCASLGSVCFLCAGLCLSPIK